MPLQRADSFDYDGPLRAGLQAGGPASIETSIRPGAARLARPCAMTRLRQGAFVPAGLQGLGVPSPALFGTTPDTPGTDLLFKLRMGQPALWQCFKRHAASFSDNSGE